MRISRREFGALGATVYGAAIVGGTTGVQGAAEAEVGAPPLQAKVEATILFEGLLGIAATVDWKKAKVLLLDAGRSTQKRTIPFHLPMLSVPKNAVSGPPPFPDDQTSDDWIWYVSKQRVTFRGVGAGALKTYTTVKCPTTPDQWRDPAFIADARKILNDPAKGVAYDHHVTDDAQKLLDLATKQVSTQVVLPNGTLACRQPTWKKYRLAIFVFDEYGHEQPLADQFEVAVEPSEKLTIVLTSFFGGAAVEIPLKQEKFEIKISNLLPRGGPHKPVLDSHFVALYDFVQDASPYPGYVPYDCETGEELPEDKKYGGGMPDDPIYCPPIRSYVP